MYLFILLLEACNKILLIMYILKVQFNDNKLCLCLLLKWWTIAGFIEWSWRGDQPSADAQQPWEL